MRRKLFALARSGRTAASGFEKELEQVHSGDRLHRAGGVGRTQACGELMVDVQQAAPRSSTRGADRRGQRALHESAHTGIEEPERRTVESVGSFRRELRWIDKVEKESLMEASAVKQVRQILSDALLDRQTARRCTLLPRSPPPDAPRRSAARPRATA